MPARARKSIATIDVGGVEVTAEQITATIEILSFASGIMVRQPLSRAGHPLAEANYHAVASEQRVIEDGAKSQTKPAFARALERLAAGD